jgi:hypothetical protein
MEAYHDSMVSKFPISHVTKEFKNVKEINTVFYDPKQITIENMVKALKAADTFRGLAE